MIKFPKQKPLNWWKIIGHSIALAIGMYVGFHIKEWFGK